MKYLIERTWLNYVREPLNTVARVLENVFLSLFVGMLYFNSGYDQQSVNYRVGYLFFMMNIQAFLSIVNAVLTFSEERAVFEREKVINMYHTSAYFLGKTLLEIPIQLLLSVIFGFIGYFMAGLNSDGGPFFKFVLCLTLIGNATHSIGLALGACFPHPVLVMILCPLVMVPFMLMTGFFVNAGAIPVYMVWLKALSPHRYVFEAMMATEFQDLELHCNDNEYIMAPSVDGGWKFCPIKSGTQILSTFRIDPDVFWENAAITLGLVIGFRFLAYLALRFVAVRRVLRS